MEVKTEPGLSFCAGDKPFCNNENGFIGMMKTWEISDSLKLYHIENWGSQYFNINPSGNITVYPSPGKGIGIDLTSVVSDIQKRNLKMPLLVRFQDIIRHRVVSLNETFKKTIEELGYPGVYRGVYPIKVNQLREVVEEIVEAGEPYHFGLEAGSKAELTAVLGTDLSNESLIICNGYKDNTYVRAALMGRKLGKNVIIVVEKLTELQTVISVAEEMKVIPKIGIRLKLSTKGSGKWESSAGDGAKFGLSTPELLYAISLMKEAGLEDSFELLHFHIGSQITDIRTIKDAVKEATRFYAKIKKMGLSPRYLDVGGGLGVDYDGSQTNFDSSINYTLKEYVADVVYTIKEVCDAEEVPVPDIVSESGRALVAHHSVLLVNVFGSIEVGSVPKAIEDLDLGFEESDDENDIVKEIRYVHENLTHKNLLESFHDALQFKDQALSMFKLGILSLDDRAKAEQLFWQTCHKIYRLSQKLKYVNEEIEDLAQTLADQYLCNFSIFQSLVDHWAIQHLFPIVPIHRHDEEPTRESTLVDITCDSDGKISKFIDLKDINDTIKVHELKPDEPYYLGIFLMGAYQDIMGDMHNLFGRVNEAHVFLDETEPGGYYVEEVIRGNNISEVLSSIQYSVSDLKKSVKREIEGKVREGVMKPREGVEFQRFYSDLLESYTYMDVSSPEELIGEKQGKSSGLVQTKTNNNEEMINDTSESGI